MLQVLAEVRRASFLLWCGCSVMYPRRSVPVELSGTNGSVGRSWIRSPHSLQVRRSISHFAFGEGSYGNRGADCRLREAMKAAGDVEFPSFRSLTFVEERADSLTEPIGVVVPRLLA